MVADFLATVATESEDDGTADLPPNFRRHVELVEARQAAEVAATSAAAKVAAEAAAVEAAAGEAMAAEANAVAAAAEVAAEANAAVEARGSG